MNINEFRSVLVDRDGLQKLDRYKLRFAVPPCLSGFDSNSKTTLTEAVRWMEFFCNMADLPGLGLATRPINRYGYGVSEKKPAFAVFTDVMLNILIDGKALNIEFFHQWLSTIYNFQFYNTIRTSAEAVQGKRVDVYEVTYKKDYAVEAFLTLYNVHGEEVYTIVMRDFFPTLLPEVKLAWEQTQNFMNLVVMFSFTDWYLVRVPPKPAKEQPPVSVKG